MAPKITSEQPLNTFQLSKLVIPRDLKLADPGFFKRSGIDILLGQEVFYELHKTIQTIVNSFIFTIVAFFVHEGFLSFFRVS